MDTLQSLIVITLCQCVFTTLGLFILEKHILRIERMTKELVDKFSYEPIQKPPPVLQTHGTFHMINGTGQTLYKGNAVYGNLVFARKEDVPAEFKIPGIMMIVVNDKVAPGETYTAYM